MLMGEFSGIGRRFLPAEQGAFAVPKGRRKHHAYDEEVNEPASLIEDEAVEVEQEIPIEENESVESGEAKANSDAAVFEE